MENQGKRPMWVRGKYLGPRLPLRDPFGSQVDAIYLHGLSGKVTRCRGGRGAVQDGGHGGFHVCRDRYR